MLSFDEFDRQFPTDEACKAYIVAKRWPNGVRCPRCGHSFGNRVYALKKPFTWTCCNVECGGRKGYRFSVTSGTIFQDTKVSLRIWFKIGYLMLTAKKGISSLQVRRVIFGEDSGTDWRTAWYICHRWRCAMRGDAFPLEGEVEADETFIGGKDANRHWDKKSAQRRKADPRGPLDEKIGYGKVEVLGAIQRKGNVVAKVVGGMDAPTLASFVRQTVSDDVTLLATDENPAYRYVSRKLSARHEVVQHGRSEYVRGNVHTNNIENFWSLLKRGVVGTFHNVSKDYLPLYLNEFSFRHNNRQNPDAFGEMVTTCSH
ncbi:MAG TPA: IS1595 family transposase [Candidatus Binataceae bacterium]|nr:IS1595 family transposase [Candidatus Binataceae bacterium]